MLRRALAAAFAMCAGTAGAQRMPGRDLFTYPLGLMGEPAALGAGAASGLWNPATALLQSGERARLAASGLSAPIDLALTAQVLHGAISRRAGTLALGVARAAITGLVHTETDPQSVGGDIPYNNWVVSLGAARRVMSHVDAGVALRWQRGQVASQHRNALATDVGVIVDSLTSRDIRVGVSGFLLTLDADRSPTLAAAFDFRVAGGDSLRTVRGGFAYTQTRAAAREAYPFLDARFSKVNVRGGPVRISAYGRTAWRMRLALSLVHAGYTIGVVREDNDNGLAPTYQLGVSKVYR